MSKRVVPQGLGKPDNPLCAICRRPWKRSLLRFDYGAAFLGYFPADVCPRGHAFFTAESSDALEAISQAAGLWGKPPPRVWPRPRGRLGAKVPRRPKSATKSSGRRKRAGIRTP